MTLYGMHWPKTFAVVFFTGGTAASAGSAPSYMDKINSIVNGDTKRKRDAGDDEGKEDY